jgi:hypothetical protein
MAVDYSPIKVEPPESSECIGIAYADPTPSYDSAAGALWLFKRAVHAILCIAIPVCIWAVVIRWSSEKVIEQLPKSDPKVDMMKHVKNFEIREFDMEGFRKSMGLPGEKP